MDKMSIKILRHLEKQKDKTSRKDIVKKFGDGAGKSLSYLERNNYIQSDKRFAGVDFGNKPIFLSTGMYEIAPLGLDFLESKPGLDFDRWLNRISIIASILGGALLSKPLWTVIDWISDWLVKHL